MDVKNTVLNIIKNELEIDEKVDMALPMTDIGIDSIRLMMLIVNIEEELNIEFDDDVVLGDIVSLNDLVKTIEEME